MLPQQSSRPQRTPPAKEARVVCWTLYAACHKYVAHEHTRAALILDIRSMWQMRIVYVPTSWKMLCVYYQALYEGTGRSIIALSMMQDEGLILARVAPSLLCADAQVQAVMTSLMGTGPIFHYAQPCKRLGHCLCDAVSKYVLD